MEEYGRRQVKKQVGDDEVNDYILKFMSRGRSIELS